MTKPELLDPAICKTHELKIDNLRHATVVLNSTSSSFIPNNIRLGVKAEPSKCLLITGPNMGGKSTLLRSVCLAVVLA
jgi:DNA mismatch repair protein MSH6